MESKSKFIVGEQVKLVSDQHGDDEFNPLWGGGEGYVVGTVKEIEIAPMPVIVAWNNGRQNSYFESDLEQLLTTKDETVLKESTPMKTLTTKEDYLNKLLEGVIVMQKIKEMNLEENKMIDDFIASLVEEMKPEEQRKKEAEERKKEEEEKKKEEEASKKEEEKGEASPKNPSEKQGKEASPSPSKGSPSSSSGTPAESKSGTELNEKLSEFMKAMQEMAKESKGSEVKETGSSISGETEEVREMEAPPTSGGSDAPPPKDGTEPAEGGAPLNIKTPFEGGSAVSRNRGVKKDRITGKLTARPKKL